jgi:pre-rRNA-processing protein TSR3
MPAGRTETLSTGEACAYPPTIIVRHPKERLEKCTIWPLRGRTDLIFLRWPLRQPLALDNYILLDPDGEPLSDADQCCGLLILDGSWRWARRMARDFQHVPTRSLRGYRTAYPRVSKLFRDPEQGLATVEALYIAYRILGRRTDGLLEHYHWREEFLRLNGWA